MSYDRKVFDRGNRDDPDDPIVRRVMARHEAMQVINGREWHFPHRLLDVKPGMDADTAMLLSIHNPMLSWIPFADA